MRHVFVESNWVFDCCAPRHLRKPAAERLLQQAEEGLLVLHLPAICLREGAESIRQRCKPRIPDEMGGFLRSARRSQLLTDEVSRVVEKALQLYQSTVTRELHALDATLEEVRTAPGVEAFALSDDMLLRAIQLRSEVPSGLKPFDESILAAVLVRARELRDTGEHELLFCTLDTDLQPWMKKTRERSEPLATLYENAGIRVQGDFLLD